MPNRTDPTDPTDEDLERLVSGLPPRADGLDDLAALVAGVRSAYLVAVGTPVEDRHVGAIVAEAEAAGAAGGRGRAARRARRAAKRPAGMPVWRRRTLAGSVFASVGTKVAGVAVAAVAATGGLAATGNLPDAAQTAVADVVGNVGIHIPNPADKPDGGAQDAGRPEEPGKSVSEDVEEAVGGTYESGADKGAAVSETASQNRRDDEHAQDPGAGETPTPPAGNPNAGDAEAHPGTPGGNGPGGNGKPDTPRGNAPAFEFEH